MRVLETLTLYGNFYIFYRSSLAGKKKRPNGDQQYRNRDNPLLSIPGSIRHDEW
jgi:hypothetical protein